MKTVMVKVGGSLLTLPDLPDRLEAMIDNIRADRVMLLVGGGQAADVVRSWDETHRLDTEASHWLAIDAMGLTTRLMTKLLPDAELVSDRASAHQTNVPAKTVILDPGPVIEEASFEAAKTLPSGWDCTSDAIAGWLASRWKVASLVLAKSIDIPMPDASSTQPGSGVDPVFQSVISDSIPVYWCNVRTDPEATALWKHASARSSL
jgi:aspartokinase-like uncharacterized kinase